MSPVSPQRALPLLVPDAGEVSLKGSLPVANTPEKTHFLIKFPLSLPPFPTPSCPLGFPSSSEILVKFASRVSYSQVLENEPGIDFPFNKKIPLCSLKMESLWAGL